jgi:hypothetical protein
MHTHTRKRRRYATRVPFRHPHCLEPRGPLALVSVSVCVMPFIRLHGPVPTRITQTLKSPKEGTERRP